MRWLRASWAGVRWVWRHGYALWAAACGLAVVVVGLVPDEHASGAGPIVDGLVLVGLGAGCALFVYGGARLVGWLYGRGILRGESERRLD